METNPILISLSPEVFEVLNDNEIDLVSELQKAYPEAEISRDHSLIAPSGPDEEKEKSVALLIIASATAFYIISQGIEKILNALGNNRKAIVKPKTVANSNSGNTTSSSPNQPEGGMQEVERKVNEKSKTDIKFLGLSVSLENERSQC